MKIKEFEKIIEAVYSGPEPEPDRYWEPSRALQLRMIAAEMSRIAWSPIGKKCAQEVQGKALLFADELELARIG